MQILPTGKQSFGRIIAPEKYVRQQLSEINNAEKKSIAKGLVSIVKQSKSVDILVNKNGKTTIRFNYPYAKVVGKKSQQVHNVPYQNNFIEALLLGAIHDKKSYSLKKLSGYLNKKITPNSYAYRIKAADIKYQPIEDAKKFGIAKLLKTNHP